MQLTNILLENLKGKALEQIAEKVGGDSVATKAITAKALPMILKQFEKNTSDEAGAESLNKALDAHTGESKIDVADGMNILGHLFGDKDNAVAEVAKATGQDTEKSAGVMGALSSVIMETLGDQKKAAWSWFGAGDLMKMLSGTGKDSNILEMVMDQDGDGDFDKNDVMKFGFGMLKKKFFGRK